MTSTAGAHGKESSLTLDRGLALLQAVADSESDMQNNPGFETGIRIGDAKTGWVRYFIVEPGGDPRTTTGSGAEFVTVDRHLNVFGGEPRTRVLRKLVKVW